MWARSTELPLYGGLDLHNGEVINNMDIQDMGVIEPTIANTKRLRFATDAAISILRIAIFRIE